MGLYNESIHGYCFRSYDGWKPAACIGEIVQHIHTRREREQSHLA